MVFYKGFIIWGIIVVLVAAICFALWKIYFCRVRGFENRKSTALIGCILILITTSTYMFIPLVMCKAKLFTETKDTFVEGIKSDIVNKTRAAFYKEADKVLADIIEYYTPDYTAKFISIQNKIPEQYQDYIIEDLPPEALLLYLDEIEIAIIGRNHNNVKVSNLSEVLANEFDRAKKNVGLYALKYSKNRTLKDSLNNAFKLLRVGDCVFEGLSEENTLEACNKIVERYSNQIRKDYVKNKLMAPWVSNIVKYSSMESFTGLAPDEKMMKGFNKAKDAFDKLFLKIASYLSLGTAIIIILIIFMLREKEEKMDDKSKRSYMFEYNQTAFEEMNTKKI